MGTRLFADWYRFGPRGEAAPLVYYVGGAITDEEYERRMATQPEPILLQFRSAFAAASIGRVDLLVSSSPPEEPQRHARVGQDFLAHLQHDLLPRTSHEPPTALAFVGYSYGAYLATYLAVASAATRGLAVLGSGIGIADAAEKAPRAAPLPVPTLTFANEDDWLTTDDVDLERILPGRRTRRSSTRGGGKRTRTAA